MYSNKIIYITILCTFIPCLLMSQSVDYNKIIIPDDVSGPLKLSEKLVQLAWKNLPENAILYKQLDNAEYQLKLERWGWLNNISLSSNFNEFSINPPEELEGNIFFPRYNISAAISLGTFITSPTSVKVAKKNKEIAENQIKSQKIKLRAAVLAAYQNYITAEKLYQISFQSAEDEYSRYLFQEEKFKKGELSLEEYNSANDKYSNAQVAKINAENAYLNAKFILESFIGINLEDVEN